MPRNSASKPNTPETTKTSSALSPPAPRRTKKNQLIGMLSRKGGVTGAVICKTLGWQPHTTRAAITRLRKSGHRIETAKPANGGTGLIYRIVREPAASTESSGKGEAHR